MKRAIASLAALALLAACGSSPEESNLDENRVGAMADYAIGAQFKATEPITFDMLYSDHPNYPIKNDWLFWQELTKRTNITITPSVVPASDYNQKRGLVVSAGDAPFIIPKVYPPQEQPFVASGAILPVSDYLDLMPHFKDKIAKWKLEPQIDNLRLADGKFYVLPGLHENVWQDYTLAVRTDVLQELGLQPPKTWDQLYTTLKAMKARYPDSYPFSDRFAVPDRAATCSTCWRWPTAHRPAGATTPAPGTGRSTCSPAPCRSTGTCSPTCTSWWPRGCSTRRASRRPTTRPSRRSPPARRW